MNAPVALSTLCDKGSPYFSGTHGTRVKPRRSFGSLYVTVIRQTADVFKRIKRARTRNVGGS